MPSGRAGLPGRRSFPAAGGWEGLMPDDAGIRQPGFKAHSRPLAELDVLVNF